MSGDSSRPGGKWSLYKDYILIKAKIMGGGLLYLKSILDTQYEDLRK